jgi:peptide-methionine (S)-S-oxide reductase
MTRSSTAMMGVIGAIAWSALCSAAGLPNPAIDQARTEKKTETAVFAGDCFWGIQAVFAATKGVSSAISGYSGGSKANAQYEIVSTGTTGHADRSKSPSNPPRSPSVSCCRSTSP